MLSLAPFPTVAPWTRMACGMDRRDCLTSVPPCVVGFDSFASCCRVPGQTQLFEAARTRLHARMVRVDSYRALVAGLEAAAAAPTAADTPAFFVAPWSESDDAEAAIKADCKATVRCYPVADDVPSQFRLAPGDKCFYTGEPATTLAVFARAF